MLDLDTVRYLFNYIYKQPHHGSVYIYVEFDLLYHLKFK